jgi:Ca2+-binding EF-hand superfamily protein
VENPTKVERETKQYTLSASATSGGGQKKGDKRGRDPMAVMDSNGDGQLSRSEVRGPLKNDFSRIDRNNDGFITVDELPKRPMKK